MSVRIPRDDRNEVARIVDAFRDLKSNLGLRPNYHQKENRVDGHIFISVLAYHLLHSIEHSLRHRREIIQDGQG